MKGFVCLLALLTASASQAASGQGGAQTPGKTLGNAVAAVVIEVFSDFQCPSCKALYEQTLRPLVDDYVRTGKVYLVHKDFPLPMHAYAREAARYACAAERVGRYEDVAKQLFLMQTSWAASGKVDATACSVLSEAEARKVRVLAKSPEVEAEIESDIRQGQTAKIQSTPTMVIMKGMRRYPVSGVVSYTVLRSFIDSLLTN